MKWGMPIYQHTDTKLINAIMNKYIVINSHQFRKGAITNRHIGSKLSSMWTKKHWNKPNSLGLTLMESISHSHLNGFGYVSMI